MSGSLDKLGIIVGDATPTDFYFIADEDRHPPRWEYVLVKSKEELDGVEKEVYAIGQISNIYSSSQALSNELTLKAVERIVNAGLIDRRLFAKTRVLGFIYNGKVLLPRRAIYPGNIVYRAPRDILEEFYSYPQEEGLYIGNLINREDVRVSISINGLRRHLAILAQTGAGKSYTAGVLLEELFKKGATVIVLDPHADYVFLSRKKDNSRFSNRVEVYRTPNSTGRYDESQLGRLKDFSVRFSDLSGDEIIDICRILQNYTNIITAIRLAINSLKADQEKKDNYSIEDLIVKLEEISNSNDKDVKKGAISALKYIRPLTRLNVFADETTEIEDILQPKHISVLDLSGLDDNVSDYIAYRLLTNIYNLVESQRYEYPVFILIEEAHRLIPNKENALSKSIIKRIAAEGRKFGLFLVLITQRPYKIDQDALSQCNSQIIMRLTNPEDQKAIRASSERLSEDLLNDLPGLNVGEAVIVGEVVKAPVIVKVRERTTKEGGADIDLIGKLVEAINAVDEDEDKGRKLMENLKNFRNYIED